MPAQLRAPAPVEDGVESIVAGSNITVDDTDPANPVISATGGGGGGTFLFEQDVPATLWTIVHGLGFFPNVTTVDTLDREIVGAVEYVDADTVTVEFSNAVTGKAYLS